MSASTKVIVRRPLAERTNNPGRGGCTGAAGVKKAAAAPAASSRPKPKGVVSSSASATGRTASASRTRSGTAKPSKPKSASASTTRSSEPARVWTFQDFEVGRTLGRGKFGKVFLAREKKSGTFVALKVMLKSDIMEGDRKKQLRRELEIQSHLQHPNILRLYGYFHNERQVFLVLEYARGGELYKKLQQCKYFDEPRAAKYMLQLVSALHYCHSKGVIHRDLKLENILLSDNDQIKLGDFGCSVHSRGHRRRTVCGTLDYLTPEMLSGQRHDQAVDRWALGILLFEMLVGRPPFLSESEVETVAMIKEFEESLPFPDHVSPEARDLICQLLRRNPSERIPLADVPSHPFFKVNATLPETEEGTA